MSYLLNDADTISSLGDQSIALLNINHALEDFGINPTSSHILFSSNLLTKTTVSKIALYSTSFYSPDDIASKIAVESIYEDIKTKLSSMSAKILKMIKTGGTEILQYITKTWDRIKSKIDSIKTKLSDAADYAKRTAKAHPYKTIAAALAASVATIGIFSFVSRMAPPLKDTNLHPKFMKKLSELIENIPWPFGKITATLSSNKTKLKVSIAAATAATIAIPLVKLGWNPDSLDKVKSNLAILKDKVESTRPSIGPRLNHIVSDAWTITKGLVVGTIEGAKQGYNSFPDSGNKTKNTAGVAGGIFVGFMVAMASVVYVLYQLLKVIVLGTFKLFMMTSGRILNSEIEEQYL